MDSGKSRLLFLMILAELMCVAMGNLVFQVHHKYGGRGQGKAALGALRAHDSRRHGRMLSAIDFQLGGDGSPTNAAYVDLICFSFSFSFFFCFLPSYSVNIQRLDLCVET